MTTLPDKPLLEGEARDLHITLVGNQLRQATIAEVELRGSLSEAGRKAMKLVVLELFNTLDELNAVQCDSCAKWFHKSLLTEQEVNDSPWPRTYDICEDCIDCPADPVEDPVPAREFR